MDVPAVDATEEETGLTAGSKCTACDYVAVAQEIIPMIESGCGSSVVGIGSALVVMSVLGVAVVLKKKED